MITRTSIEADRVRVFNEMVSDGASFKEALAYIDLVHPFEVEVIDTEGTPIRVILAQDDYRIRHLY